jgi:hypothetical protein
MNKLLLEVEYQKFLVCANTKDEQMLLDILSRARIVKRDWGKNDLMYYNGEIPKIMMVDGNTILAEEPKPAEESAE